MAQTVWEHNCKHLFTIVHIQRQFLTEESKFYGIAGMRRLSGKLSKFENHLIETAFGAILMLKRSLYCVLWQLKNLGSMNNETGRREGRGAVKRFFVIFSGATPQLKISVSARSVSNQEFKNWQNLSLFGQFFRKQCKEKCSQGMDTSRLFGE